jgi:hypothetical protein
VLVANVLIVIYLVRLAMRPRGDASASTPVADTR